MLDLRRLRVLLAVAEHGGVAAAARALSFTPPAVSQQIAALERQLDVALLDRSQRTARLTSTGQWLADHARDLIADLEGIEAEIARIDGKIHGVLRVGVLPTLGYTLLPSTLTHLATTAPELEVRIQQLEPEESLAALARGELDVALAGEYSLAPRRDDTNFDRVDLYTEQMLIAVPANHRLRGPHVALADLRDDRWIAPAPGTSCAVVLERACALVGYEPHVIGVCADFMMAAALVGAGNGIALIPGVVAPLIARFGDTPKARLLTMSIPSIDRTLFAAVRQGTRNHPAVSSFLESLTKAAQQLSNRHSTARPPGIRDRDPIEISEDS
ncbi:LysR family transcriptional regulator [Nonomuraea sp. NPDC003707]